MPFVFGSFAMCFASLSYAAVYQGTGHEQIPLWLRTIPCPFYLGLALSAFAYLLFGTKYVFNRNA